MAHALYLGKQGEAPKQVDLGPKIAEAFDPRFSADGTEIIFTAIPTNPKKLLYGEEVTGLYDGLHRLWAMNANGTNPHPIVPEEAVTYGAPFVVGENIVVSQKIATYISFGDGGTIRYSNPTISRLDVKGGAPRTTAFRGVEPTASASAVVNKGCPPGHSPCGSMDMAAAARYAEWFGNEDHPRNGYYHDFGSDNCTNFLSQILARGNMIFMRAYEHGDGSWWYRRAKHPKGKPDWTRSWTLADQLPRHLWEYGLANRDPINKPSGWTRGDILAEDWYGTDGRGNFNHLQFVVRSFEPPGGPREPLIANESSEHHNYSHVPWSRVKERIEREQGTELGRVPLRVQAASANVGETVPGRTEANLYEG